MRITTEEVYKGVCTFQDSCECWGDSFQSDEFACWFYRERRQWNFSQATPAELSSVERWISHHLNKLVGQGKLIEQVRESVTLYRLPKTPAEIARLRLSVNR